MAYTTYILNSEPLTVPIVDPKPATAFDTAAGTHSSKEGRSMTGVNKATSTILTFEPNMGEYELVEPLVPWYEKRNWTCANNDTAAELYLKSTVMDPPDAALLSMGTANLNRDTP